MKRRSFLKTTGTAVTLPLILNNTSFAAIPQNALSATINGDNDKVLVLIQLGGGNDGLNTIIPTDQYSNLSTFRSSIMIPESSVLPLTLETGLNPAMPGMKSLYDNAKINILQSVGYPNQNRSHFRSTDIWHTGSAADQYLTSGWMGRYFDLTYPGFPDAYPNADCPDPFAITIGSIVSETCQGTGGNFSMALTDPSNLDPLATGSSEPLPDTCYGDELGFLRQSIIQTNEYATVIGAADGNGANVATYPDTGLANKLKIVARLIAGGLRTKVYVVSLTGFDTHANQVQTSDTTLGDHAALLGELSGAIDAFQQDIEGLGVADRIIGMTYSEFGRRIYANASSGTDHGTAAPMILFGNCVNAGIYNANPVIPTDLDTNVGVEMEIDFRNVYGSILMDWFDVPETTVQGLLFSNFQYLPIISCPLTGFCEIPSNSGTEIISGNVVRVYWDAVAGATKYRVNYRIKGVGDPWTEVIATINERFIHGLELSTDYEWRVKAVCEAENSVWSAIDTFTTSTDLCALPPSSSVTIIGLTSVRVDWVKNPDDLKYKIKYKKQGGDWTEVTVNTNSYTITGLEPGEKYKYKLKTKCTLDWMNWGDKEEFVMPQVFQGEQLSKVAQPKTDIRLYPNPTSGIVHVDLGGMNAQSVRICYLNGREAISVNNVKWSTRLDASSLPAGIYMVKVITQDQELITKRFMKL